MYCILFRAQKEVLKATQNLKEFAITPFSMMLSNQINKKLTD